MKPIVIPQSSNIDYNKNDFTKLTFSYICAFIFAALMMRVFKSNELAKLYNIQSNNINFYLIMFAAFLFGSYEGFLYFRKYRFQIKNKLAERKKINIIWLIMFVSIMILFFDQSDATVFPDFSKFLFILSIVLSIKYHFSLS